MKQTGENGKKPNFGPDFGLLGPNLGPKPFLWVLPLLVLVLVIVPSYHSMQLKGKLMNQT